MERSPAVGFKLTAIVILHGVLSKQICPFASEIQSKTTE